MGRVAATFGGVLVLACIAGGLAEATMAFGTHGSLSNDNLLRPTKTASKATPTPTPVPAVATPLPTTLPTTVPTPVVKTGTTTSFVHMRAGKSTSTPVVIDLNGGSVVEILPDSDAQWQQVKYAGQSGYIFKAYLTY
jgi:hypothetical protein